jgi:hypothetical protein
MTSSSLRAKRSAKHSQFGWRQILSEPGIRRHAAFLSESRRFMTKRMIPEECRNDDEIRVRKRLPMRSAHHTGIVKRR